VVVPVTIEFAVAPALIAAGDEAASENVDWVTVTVAAPVAALYAESPE